MFALDARLLPLLLICNTVIGSASTTFTAPSAASTCPSRTINYLTHTLHQQCLPSSRSIAGNSTASGNSTITNVASLSHTTDVSIAQWTALQSEIKSTGVPFESAPEISSTTKPLETPVQSVATFVVTAVASTVAVPLLPDPIEDESPLESGNFLSFEDWKKRNLIKVGQSEHLGRQDETDHREPRRRASAMHDTLDSLGDDAEIDLDFSGLVPGGPDTATEELAQKASLQNPQLIAMESEQKPKGRAWNKDAGTTCKERFNYASFDCAANVLKSNRETKSSHAVLIENKDSYMLNQCSAKEKFIVLELCDYIWIDTIVLANFEFFSSIFRTFRVSVSDKYPVKLDKWKLVGTFEARNTRDIQAFLVENPVIWAKYVKVEFLTHYGNEFYCPISLIRVHGTTMMEDYKHHLEASMGEDEDGDIENEENVAQSGNLIPEAVDQALLIEQHHDTISSNQAVDVDESAEQHRPDSNYDAPIRKLVISPNEAFLTNNSLSLMYVDVCLPDELPLEESPPAEVEGDIAGKSAVKFSGHSDRIVGTEGESAAKVGIHSTREIPSLKESSMVSTTTSKVEEHPTSSHVDGSDSRNSPSVTMEPSGNQSTSKEPIRSVSSRQQPSTVQSPPASPTMQESFFKSVQKRLQMLESNSSLSLQYIEEQSRALRDAFRKVEQRQLSKTTNFLEHLNHTVLSELREFRQQYDQLWQSTVIELELQRERYQYESQAMHARLGVLADELIFQKRVSIFQTVLIVVCLALVLFSQGILNTYLELPLLQSVLARSPNSKWITVPGDSQANSPQIVRTRSAHQLGAKQGILKSHRRGLSEDSNTDTLNPPELYSPPTPVSFDGFSDNDSIKMEPRPENPEFDPSAIKRPSTSPPVLPSIEDPTTPRNVNSFGDVTIQQRLATANPSPSSDHLAPQARVRHPTPPGKHLKWNLPEGQMNDGS